jgi:hypothetical protein
MIHNKCSLPVMALALLSVVACSPTDPKDETTNNEMKLNDHHSFAQPEEAVITHLNWVDNFVFESKLIRATADYDIKT